MFVPQTRSERRPSIDILGVLLSSAGLALLMYGLVEAGDNGWGSSSAIVPSSSPWPRWPLFVLWEAWLTARPGGQPLVDLGLFRSRSFSVGVVLAAAGIFGMFGVLFTLPQYLQAIMGVDAQGAGLRFLPAIAGLVVGAVPADRVAARVGSKMTVALGFGDPGRRDVRRQRHDGHHRRRLHRRVHLRRRAGRRPGARHGRLGRHGRALGGAERRRVRAGPGRRQARAGLRGDDPRQCAQLHLPGPRIGGGSAGRVAATVQQSVFGGLPVADSSVRRLWLDSSAPLSWPGWTMRAGLPRSSPRRRSPPLLFLPRRPERGRRWRSPGAPATEWRDKPRPASGEPG